MCDNFEILFCTYFKSIENFRYEWEIYEDYTVFCVKNGSFSFKIDDGNEKILSAGQAVICPPNKKFSRKIIEPTELCMIKFKSSAPPPAERVISPDSLRMGFNLERLEACFFCWQMSENPVFRHYCKDILFMLFDGTRENGPFDSVCAFLKSHFSEKISVSRLAEKAGYSTAQFINKFSAAYNETPKAFLSSLRIQRAKELLITTDKTSREIAALCGFEDELYFIRFFKKKTGTTPKQFRTQKI